MVEAILLQYSRFANIYFLLIGILSSVSSFDAISSNLIWFPIVVVLFVSLVREAYEDYMRYRMDCKVNFDSIAHIYTDGAFVDRQWGAVRTGDVVKVLREEMFPADMLLIQSENKEGAYIDTATLDGETAYKPRVAIQLVDPLPRGTILCIDPNRDLNVFEGRVTCSGQTVGVEGVKSYLFRGARLKGV